SALSTRAPTVAAATITNTEVDGASPSATAATARPSAATSPAAVPSKDIAPGVPAETRRRLVTRNVERPQALPTSLATVSLPPAVNAVTSATSAAPGKGVQTAAIAATAATPQFAKAFPAPRRPPRSSAIPNVILRVSPSLDAAVARKKVRKRKIQAAAPPHA